MVFESWTVFLLHVRCFFNVIKCCRHWMLKANSYISRFWPWIPEINCASVLWHLLWLSLYLSTSPSIKYTQRNTHTETHTHAFKGCHFSVNSSTKLFDICESHCRVPVVGWRLIDRPDTAWRDPSLNSLPDPRQTPWRSTAAGSAGLFLCCQEQSVA